MLARLCLGAPSRFHDADCANCMDFSDFLSFRGWLCPLETMRPAAPEVQLRDVVWSDESLCRLYEQQRT